MTKILDFSKSNPGQTRWNDLGEWVQDGHYMRLDTIPNDHNASGAEVEIGDNTEAWLTYQVLFSSEHVFGRNEKAHSVGGKMPGLGSSGPFEQMNGNYTGGNHRDDGFSGRLMWRGHNSEGKSYEPADGFSIGLYSYDYELATNNDLTYGRSFMFRKPEANEVNPWSWEDADTNNGTGPGQIGDTDVWTLPIGEWITITCGYGVGVAGTDNWFEAWVSTESSPTPWRALYLDGRTSDFRWMSPAAEPKIDTFLFQSYWGGRGNIWLPDRPSVLAYKGIEVHDSMWLSYDDDVFVDDDEPEVIDTAGGVDTGLGGSMRVTVNAIGATGSEELELVVDGHLCPRRFIVPPGDVWSYTWTGLLESPDIVVRFVNDGDDARNLDRNVEVVEVDALIGGSMISVKSTNPLVVSTGTFPHCGDELTGGHDGMLHCNGELRFKDAILAALPEPPLPPPPDVDEFPEVDRICQILRSFTPAAQIQLLAKVLVSLAEKNEA